MVFFESRDCLKKDPPLSSFEFCEREEDFSASSPLPSWAKAVHQAVTEAKKKMGFGFRLHASSR